ncbi:MAG: PKD domain-containing protein [Bacteroidetes bacterium]|nr:PKD domain-containing protein [Bacteroidota bacterium]
MKKHLQKFFSRALIMFVLSMSFFSTQEAKAYCDYLDQQNNGTYTQWFPSSGWQTSSNYLVVGDCHWYFIYALAGRQYTFKTGCGDGAISDVGFDTYLTIFDWPNGNLLAADDDNCYDPANPLKSIVTYTSPVDQYLIIKVSAYADASGGNYIVAYNEVIPCTVVPGFTATINGATADFADVSSGTVTSYAWDFGDGNVSNLASPSNTYTCSGNYNVVLTVSELSGCTNQTSQVINVVVPGGSQAAFTNSASGNIITFTDVSTGTIPTHNWDFGDGTFSTAISPVKTYTCAGGYSVSLTTIDNTGCTSVSYGYVIAEGDPQAEFNIRSVSGFTVNIGDVSTGTGLTYSYDFGDGTAIDTASNPTHTYSCPGSYLITLVVNSNGPCTSAPFYRYINILGNPTASFIYSTSGQTATFYNKSVGGISSAWAFGDGNTSTAIGTTTNTYACPGNYYVTLTTTSASGCVTSNSQLINVTGDPTPDFTYTISGTTVDFTSTSTGTSLSYMWYFENGQTSTSQNPQFIYTCGGDKYVTLVTTNLAGCVVSTTKKIHVIGDPNPSFITNVTGSTASFVYSGTGNAATWAWDFGDGSTSNTAGSFAHQYTCPGNYDVELEITGVNGCVVQFNDVVTIVSTPTADFNFTAAGTVVTFADASTGTGLTYNWQFGDGSNSTSQNPTHTFVCGGTYYVTLTTSNGTCSSSINKIVEAIGDPYASFTFDVQGTTVNLTNTSIGNITNNFWFIYNNDYTQFQYSYDSDPSFTIGSCENYNIYYEVSNGNGCYHSIYDSISLPYAGVAPVINVDSSLTALASGADSYEWIDCATGTPVAGATSQTFNAPVDGSYAVIVTNGACSDTSECLTVDRIFVGLNEDITESNVSVYPNPSTNRFLLQTDGTGHMVIEVTDMIGRIVYSKNITANGNLIQVIDLGNETAGVYLLKLHSVNGGVVTKKLVKN